MKRILVLTALTILCLHAGAQVWDIQLGIGEGIARLIPAGESTPTSSLVRYGFSKPGIYLAPEVTLAVSKHSKFSFGYQYSENKAGIKFVTPDTREVDLDVIDLHNFSVGYHYQILDEGLRLSAFAKAGIAFGTMVGIIGSGSGGGGPAGPKDTISSSSERLTAFEVMPDFWAATNAVGFVLGKRSKGQFMDRLTFTASAMVVWKNPYTSYSRVHYTVSDLNVKVDEIAQFQGMPVIMQFGFAYRLCRFEHKAISPAGN